MLQCHIGSPSVGHVSLSFFSLSLSLHLSGVSIVCSVLSSNSQSLNLFFPLCTQGVFSHPFVVSLIIAPSLSRSLSLSISLSLSLSLSFSLFSPLLHQHLSISLHAWCTPFPPSVRPRSLLLPEWEINVLSSFLFFNPTPPFPGSLILPCLCKQFVCGHGRVSTLKVIFSNTDTHTHTHTHTHKHKKHSQTHIHRHTHAHTCTHLLFNKREVTTMD